MLADIHLKGPVENLVREMQLEPWTEIWKNLGLVLVLFEDVGLTPTSTDSELWHRCQSEELVLITNNRNSDSPDSPEATIRRYNTANFLPVFTIGDLDAFRRSRPYAQRVLERLYENLLEIDRVRGTGRLYLP